MLFCTLRKNKIINLPETFFIENEALLIYFQYSPRFLNWEEHCGYCF